MKLSAKMYPRGGILPPLFLLLTLLLISVCGQAQNIDPPDYILGPGDLIKIQVHGEEDLSVELRLQGDGYISYPFLGEVKASGISVSALQTRIHDGLEGDYLINPDVRVYVLEYRLIYVNGEVKKPGGYNFVPGLNVQKAIALAGGFTALASKGKIYLVAEDSGERRKADINTSVDPGDTIVVEEGFF